MIAYIIFGIVLTFEFCAFCMERLAIDFESSKLSLLLRFDIFNSSVVTHIGFKNWPDIPINTLIGSNS